MIEVQEVRRADALEDHREAWQALVGGLDDVEVFQTYEWTTSWLETCWTDRPLAFHFLRRDGELVGLAPLLPDEHGDLLCRGALVAADVRRSAVIGGEAPAETLDALIEHLLRTRRGLRLALPRVHGNLPALRVLPEIAQRHHLSTVRWNPGASPRITIEGDWDRYLRSRRPHFRHELRRKTRKAESAGRLAVEVVSTPERCAAALNDVFAIENRSWKPPSPDGRARFFRTLAPRAAANGWLRLYLLRLDGEPIAHVYGLVYKNVFYALKTDYDRAYHELSPGIVLFGRLARDVHEQGLAALDFLGFEARWKAELANDLRGNQGFCCYSRWLPRCAACKVFTEGLKPWVRTHLVHGAA